MSATFVPENKMSELQTGKNENPLKEKESTEVVGETALTTKNSEPVSTGKISKM